MKKLLLIGTAVLLMATSASAGPEAEHRRHWVSHWPKSRCSRWSGYPKVQSLGIARVRSPASQFVQQGSKAKRTITKKTLLTGISALFLATGAARADEFVMLIQKGDEKPSTAFATIGIGCAELLESHERNRKARYLVDVQPPGRWRALAD